MRSRTFIVLGFLLAAVLVISSAAAEIYKDENQGTTGIPFCPCDLRLERIYIYMIYAYLSANSIKCTLTISVLYRLQCVCVCFFIIIRTRGRKLSKKYLCVHIWPKRQTFLA